jgi:hypothetical protein
MDFKNSLFIVFFQLNGLCTVQLPNKNSIREFFLCFISLFYISLIGVLFVAAYQHQNTWFTNRDPVSKLTDVMQLMCPVVAHIVCTIESLTRRQKQKKIFQLANNIDKKLLEIGINVPEANENLFKHFLMKFLLSIVISTGTELMIIYRICCGSWMEQWCGKVGSFFIDRVSDLQFLFFLDYLENRGKCLNDELLRLVILMKERNKLLGHDRKNYHMYRRLKVLKYLHNQCYKLMLNVNKRFAWSILATVTSNFMCLTVGMYWIYANFHYGTERTYVC